MPFGAGSILPANVQKSAALPGQVTTDAAPPVGGPAVWIASGTVAIVALGVYVATLAPTVTLVDSGELIVTANGLGVAHPPGFPLYLIIAHLATLVPIGSVAVRVNATSALCAAIAAGLLVLVVAEVAAPIARRRDWLSVFPAAAAGLMLALSRTVWSYATVAEVYTLNTALILAIFWLMLRWRAAVIAGSESHALMYAAALVFGLSLGVHHLTVLLTLPGIAALVVTTKGVRFLWSRPVGIAALAATAGLTVYLYLPLAALRDPVVNWGDPRTLERIWWHFSGRQYQTNYTGSPALGEFLRYATREFGPPWLALAPVLSVAGIIALARRCRPVFWMTVLVIGVDALFVASYEIAEDKDAYYLPAFVGLTVAMGAGGAWLVDWAASTRWREVAAAALLVAVPTIAFAGNVPYTNRSHDFIAHDYVTNTLSTVAPDSLVLTLDWQFYSPLLYVQEVERERRDATVISVNLMRRSWYVDSVAARFPAVFAGAHAELAGYLEDLRQWEHDPDAYARDASLTARINDRFYALLFALVESNVAVRTVYVTTDIASGQEMELTKRLGARYLPLPEGLVFRLIQDPSFQDVADLAFSFRGLNDGTMRFEDDGVVRQKIVPTYVQAFVARGAYLAEFGRFDQALPAYRQALALDPNSTAAKVGILKCENALKTAAR